jgi:Cu-Zn family superoxide dismutase
MKHLAYLLLLGATLGRAPSPETAHATLRDANGAAMGTATLTETPHGVLIRVSLTGVPAGTHAFHVHANGVCEPPFTSAGGHFNPAARQHGIENAMGMHAGDMPNVQVGADGALAFEVLNPAVTLGPGANSLLKEGGTALVLHGGADDYASDPAGNAGPRIACGVISN